jgi:hypothetical protein
MRSGNSAISGTVVGVSGIRDDVRRQLLDHGGVIVEKHRMSGVVDEASQFARYRIAGKQDTRLERLDLKSALTLALVRVTGPVAPRRHAEHGAQPTPKPILVTSNDHLFPGPQTNC